MAFRTEKELVKRAMASQYIKTLLISCYNGHYYRELWGFAGVPDLVLPYIDPSENGKREFVIIAFEMKLSDWRQALFQACGYKTFAHKSYVLMDHVHVAPPANKDNLVRFKRTNVGLLSINDEGMVVPHYEPEYSKPYSEWFEKAFMDMVFRVEGNKIPLISFHHRQFFELAIR